MVTELANPPTSQRSQELAEIIRAYNQVTQRLERSHEALLEQVERLQRELASTDAQLQRSKRLAALGEMAAGIAHEIRNPIAAIQLYARVMVEDLTALADQDESLFESVRTAGKIADAVRSLDAIVGDVLSFARDLKPRQRRTAAAALVERALEANMPAIVAAGVSVERDLDEGIELVADPDLIQQALVNVIRNAVQSMAEQSPARPRVVRVSARRQGGQVILGVADTGPGISNDDIDRIFNPFFTTRSTGTGLGLAIVHRIVDVHGGAISVRNETAGDGGAVFELNLPADGVQA